MIDPNKIAFRSHPVSLAQAAASVAERLVAPQWLTFAASGPTSVQQAVGSDGPIVTITRYEDPNSDQWVMIKQFHVGKRKEEGSNPIRHVTVDSTPVALVNLTVRAHGRATYILGALWTNRVTGKPIEVHSFGISEENLLQVVGSIR
jgi:hypothetical protein